jgi:uridine kinase
MSEREGTIKIESADNQNELLSESEVLSILASRIKNLVPEGTKVISLIGGAGSGKTTLAQRLCGLLGSADTLGTDDYVVGDRAYRREHLEGKDPIEKYDPVFLNNKIVQIRGLHEGEEVAVPTYNEATGEAIAAGEANYTHRVGKVEYLIVEGDFDFVEKPDLIIYFDVPDEIRLQNRISRDQQTRSESDPEKIKANFQL